MVEYYRANVPQRVEQLRGDCSQLVIVQKPGVVKNELADGQS